MPRFLLALLVVLGGCSGPLVRNAPDVDAPADFPNHTAEQIVYHVTAALPAVTTYRSEARISIEGPDFSQRVGASLRARLADTLYASLRGPFSIAVGRGLVTADSFFAFDQLNGTLYVGALAVAERYAPGAGTPGALAQTLLGFVAPEPEVAWQVAPDSATYVLTEPGEGLRRRYTVDPALWRVTRFEELLPDGALLTVRTFSAFDVVEEVIVPRRVTLASPLDQTELTVEHQQVRLDPESLSFPFSPPSDAEVVVLE